jgi:hypothetical protein
MITPYAMLEIHGHFMQFNTHTNKFFRQVRQKVIFNN